ncbi:MAG: hypothetical protein H3C57_10340 [Gammaproteobacteria bacterium]|nr:hypothetical protein [Gammaproteobacteria bacterium]
MNWIEVVKHWRSLPAEEQRRQALACLPRKVARSMAFEGEQVDQAMLEAELTRLTQLSTTSTPSSTS